MKKTDNRRRPKIGKGKTHPRKVLLERRDRILEAAIEVFAEKGYERCTIDDIANKAGVGRGTVYRRVGNKENFLDLLMKSITKTILENIRAAIKKRTDPIQQFKEAINALGDIFETRAQHLMVIFHLFMQANQKKDKFEDPFAKHKEHLQMFRLFESIFQRAIQRKQIRPVNVKAMAQGIIGFLNPPYYQRLRFEYNLSKSEIVQMTIDLFLNGLRSKK
jgi:AcrR family transcriptional regulator